MTTDAHKRVTKPISAQNIVDQYDDDEIQDVNRDQVIPWDEAARLLDEAWMYWWATTDPEDRPHVRPVLGLFLNGVMYSTSNPDRRKARNLEANPRSAFTLTTDKIDFIVEGEAVRVEDVSVLRTVADEYGRKYDWPITVIDGGYDAPYGAPTAGPPPYHLYRLTPHVVFGLGTDETYAGASTRWLFY